MNFTSSHKNYNPEERHWGLVGDVDTVPGGWDLSSLPAPANASENGAGEVPPQQRLTADTTVYPRLFWLVDPFCDHGCAPSYPYFAPF
jgi:hypothetical protein